MKDLGLLQSGSGKNMLFSPLTTGRCLSLMADASEGQTKEQIQDVTGDLKLLEYPNVADVFSCCSGLFEPVKKSL